MKAHVAVYARISHDTVGEGLGVERQEQDCRALAAARGWTVTQVYVDNDVSAYSGKPRPQYLAMLDAVVAGDVSGIVTWHPDRLHRSPLEFEAFAALVHRTGCHVATVQSGFVDLTTPDGLLAARVVGAYARYESQLKGERLRSYYRQEAEAGRRSPGSRPYGWEPDRLRLNPDEAGVVRWIAQRVLAGDSTREIVTGLNRKGVPNSQGRPWTTMTLRKVIMHPRNAGFRVHRGAVVPGVMGEWDPILTVAELEAVRAALSDPEWRTRPENRERRTLLTGIVRCGLCAGLLSLDGGGGTRALAYKCGRCRGLAREAARVDEHVRSVVLDRLSRNGDALVDVCRKDPHLGAATAARRLRRKVAQVEQDLARGVITSAEHLASMRRLSPRLAALEALLASAGVSVDALRSLTGSPDLCKAWDGLPLQAQRGVVAALVTIVVQPTRHGPGFIPEDVHVLPTGVIAPC